MCDGGTGTTILLKSRTMTVKTMMNPKRPGFQAERGSITMAILDAVRSRHADHIAFHFNHRCTVQMSVNRVSHESAVCQGVAFDEQKVMFEDDNGKHVSASYDVLIAADGVHSQIRRELQQFDATLDVHAYESTRGYKALRNLGALSDKGVTFGSRI